MSKVTVSLKQKKAQEVPADDILEFLMRQAPDFVEFYGILVQPEVLRVAVYFRESAHPWVPGPDTSLPGLDIPAIGNDLEEKFPGIEVSWPRSMQPISNFDVRMKGE